MSQLSTPEDEISTTPTGMQSAQDQAELAYQPGYNLPWETRDPIKQAEGRVDYTFDPIGFAKWKKRRSDVNKERAAQLDEE